MGEIIPRPIPRTPLPFTGERLTSDYGGQTQIEHLHRYLLAREWCRDREVLDVASGEGYGTALLAQVARSAVGVEIASDVVMHATKSYPGKNLVFMQGDARALPLPDQSRDVIVSFETIEHFAEQARFLEEVRRVLRPGGLFVVSTPDRDNYSPAGAPANPYHVKELTGAEFEALLRTQFAEVSVLLQRPIFGSVLLPAVEGALAPLCFERRGSSQFEASVGLARPQYLVAFASDSPAAVLPSSVYIDTGQLGMLNPAEATSSLNTAQALFEAERVRAEAAEVDNAQLRDEANSLRERVGALAADLDACRLELIGAGGEAKGLLTANMMAEQACAALRAELLLARGSEAVAQQALLTAQADRAEAQERSLHLELAAEQALLSAQADRAAAQDLLRQLEAERRKWGGEILHLEIERQQFEARLTNTLASHSWRVTAPLRRLSRIIYRRP